MPKNILTDAEIELTVYKSRKDYHENLRLVRYYDEEQDRELLFLTNAMDLTAQQIADLYKNRWQIELFFNMQLKRSTYEVLQILSISLTDKTPLRELFDKTYSNDVKEQLDPLIPGLFD